ncbi:protein EARLY RESPONSIVE TO DEHYDRATION 15-like [Typha latifolia]|uniref:protein EARLY RESPONSIVE TO DEHYDRATION 15-like n=1 Tax=Typha latifolia TaxID=4733 RepID=UPI003C2B5A7D
MDVIRGRCVSSLNPDAAPFVPVAYRAVEDYSPEWWDLVENTAWFRDYWLRECFLDPQVSNIYESDPVLPDDVDALFYPSSQEGEEEEDKSPSDIVSWAVAKWRGPRSVINGPKYAEKAPKIVNSRVSPKTIQQPR